MGLRPCSGVGGGLPPGRGFGAKGPLEERAINSSLISDRRSCRLKGAQALTRSAVPARTWARTPGRGALIIRSLVGGQYDMSGRTWGAQDLES